MTRFVAIAARLLVGAGLLMLAGCEIPPSAVFPAEAQRAARPSGTVTMYQFYAVGVGAGRGTLAVGGRTYPFTLSGSLVGPGAITGIDASGEVYNLTSLSQFSGAWRQSVGSLAVSGSGRGEIWLRNNHGVVMRLNAVQNGLALTQDRSTVFIHLDQ